MSPQRVEGHTELPWHLAPMEGAGGCREIRGYHRKEGLACTAGLNSDKEDLANAELIIYAVNNIERLEKVNEALVELAELVKRGLDSGHIKAKPIITMDPEAESVPVKCLEDFVDAALALAKEPA